MKNGKLTLLAVVAVLGLVLAACGDDSTTTTQAPATTGGITTTQAPATTGAVATTVAPTTTEATGGPAAIPADHEGRAQCLGCHAAGAGGAPIPPPAIHPADLADDRAVCATCHADD